MAKRQSWVAGRKVQRLLGLLRWLAAKDDWVNTNEMRKLYKRRTIRTVQRDIAELRSAGVPIERDERGWRLRQREAVRWLKVAP